MQAIEIAIQYDTLVRLSVSHDFFGENTPENFSFQASKETQHLLNQMGIIARYENDSAILLASSYEVASLRKKVQDTPSFTLSFALYSENPYFTHFTDLPLETKGKIFYFQNTYKNNLLHAADYASQTDLLPLVAGKFGMNEQKKGSMFALSHSFLPAPEEVEADEQGMVSVQLTHLPVGKYQLSSKQKVEADFLHVPTQAGKTLVGWIDIHIDEKLSQSWLEALVKDEKPKTTHYQIKFHTRSTYWRYYFIPKYIPTLEHTEIEPTEKGLEFEKPKEVILQNGVKATCFEAKKAMPIYKKAGKPIQLIRKKDAKGNAIRQVLCKVPYPTFEGLRAESRQADAKVFSEMIVYL